MTPESSDIDLIEGYLKNALSPEEVRLFHQRLKEDADFAEMVDDYKDIITGIKSFGHQELQNDVSRWEREIREEELMKASKRFFISRKLYLPIAASVVLLVSVAIYFFMPERARSNEELFITHFEPYEDVLSVRGDMPNAELQQALADYNRQVYPDAVLHFERYLRSNPQDFDAYFYCGLSQLASGDALEAIKLFREVIDHRSLLIEQAEWYSALARIKLNDMKVAARELDKISKQRNHDYQERAKTLLRQL
ncbi:MAG: hypothetical protein ACOYXT_16125 [Bacteroidota bacterium]